MRGPVLVLAGLVAVSLAGVAETRAQDAACTKAQFEAVVDEAAAALRALNQQNTPQFQARLRQLKDKRGWSNDQFIKEAEPFVRDDAIAEYDRKSEDFLARITGGQAEAAPDCKLLGELRAAMRSLIETQQAKWAYMFDKINKELAR
jgi:hypothetical protein